MKLLIIILLMFSGCMTEKKLAKYLDKNGYYKRQYYYSWTTKFIKADTLLAVPITDSVIIKNSFGKLNIDTLTTKK